MLANESSRQNPFGRKLPAGPPGPRKKASVPKLKCYHTLSRSPDSIALFQYSLRPSNWLHGKRGHKNFTSLVLGYRFRVTPFFYVTGPAQAQFVRNWKCL